MRPPNRSASASGSSDSAEEEGEEDEGEWDDEEAEAPPLVSEEEEEGDQDQEQQRQEDEISLGQHGSCLLAREAMDRRSTEWAQAIKDAREACEAMPFDKLYVRRRGQHGRAVTCERILLPFFPLVWPLALLLSAPIILGPSSAPFILPQPPAPMVNTQEFQEWRDFDGRWRGGTCHSAGRRASQRRSACAESRALP